MTASSVRCVLPTTQLATALAGACILLAPCSDVSDIAHDEQLKAREYFVEIDDDTLGRKLTMPGAFAKFSVTPVGPHHRAPRIGEHNADIYGGLLGLSESRLQSLRSAGGI